MILVVKRSLTANIREWNRSSGEINSWMCIKVKNHDENLLKHQRQKAFRKMLLGHVVLCGDELNLAEKLSWNTEHCAWLKQKHSWKLCKHLRTLIGRKITQTAETILWKLKDDTSQEIDWQRCRRNFICILHGAAHRRRDVTNSLVNLRKEEADILHL